MQIISHDYPNDTVTDKITRPRRAEAETLQDAMDLAGVMITDDALEGWQVVRGSLRATEHGDEGPVVRWETCGEVRIAMPGGPF